MAPMDARRTRCPQAMMGADGSVSKDFRKRFMFFVGDSRARRLLEGEAVAARPPEAGETITGRLDSGAELMGCVGTAMLVTCRVVLMLEHGYAGASGFSGVKRRAVAAEHFDGRPFRKHRERRRRVSAEFLGCVDDLSAHDGEYGFDAFDVIFG